MSSVIIFFIVLAILILVHEMGHFLSAKLVGAKVEEFGLGFPPRIWSIKFGDTIYSLNLIFFGGFVKILGEDEVEEEKKLITADSLASKTLWQQALVIVAGVSFNWLLAWIIFLISFMAVGLPTASSILQSGLDGSGEITISDIIPYSPAEQIGLMSGDKIIAVNFLGEDLSGPDLNIESFINFLDEGEESQFTISFIRDEEVKEVVLSPIKISGYDRPLVGLIFDSSVERLSFFPALRESLVLTFKLTISILIAIISLVAGLFVGDLSITEAVYGPIGIVGVVGQASQMGFFNLLFLIAVISINLAIINLLPFPALDGGRLLFIAIEGFWGKALPRRIVNTINWAGLILLLTIMILVTFGDLWRIFG